jgi:branched-chain amino acid aminotransferase
MATGIPHPIVWHNGRLLRAEDVCLSPFDQGLTIGLGAFETLVAAGGEPFAFSRHWERLVHSGRGLGLPLPDRAAVAEALRAVAAANDHRDGRLRITVTAGPGPLGSDRAASPQPTCLVVSSPRPAWPPTARVLILAWPRNDRSPLAGLKSTSYAENALALAEARRHDADEAVFPNTSGRLCEGTGSNVFLVSDGCLMTPPLTDGCLAGVTRALVLELAREMGLSARETSVPMHSLPAAQEAFLTSTTRDIQPISHVDDTALDAAPGPVTQHLQAAWRARFPSKIIDP